MTQILITSQPRTPQPLSMCAHGRAILQILIHLVTIFPTEAENGLHISGVSALQRDMSYNDFCVIQILNNGKLDRIPSLQVKSIAKDPPLTSKPAQNHPIPYNEGQITSPNSLRPVDNIDHSGFLWQQSLAESKPRQCLFHNEGNKITHSSQKQHSKN